VAAIASYQSQPVSVLGAVNNPGVRQLEGEKTLYEMLSLAGGLRPNAGNTVHITRDLRWGRIPLADAKDDPTGRFSTASVKVRAIMSAMDPKENIMIKPHDVITVQTAEVVYAVGSINKPGGFVLGENETLSTLQVVSLAEGLQKTAAADRAKILRPVPGSSSERSEIPVNIKKLLAGKAPDVPLKPNDILFVPTSAAKVARYRTVEAIVQSAIGMSVYTRF
jgi:polysaccharide biosynthesis/export protein